MHIRIYITLYSIIVYDSMHVHNSNDNDDHTDKDNGDNDNATINNH